MIVLGHRLAKCPVCNGHGRIRRPDRVTLVECTACLGDGFIVQADHDREEPSA